MKCPKCNIELRPISPLPGLRRITYPHVCIATKAFRNPSALAEAFATSIGVGPEWAQKKYGDYYAESVPVYAAVRLRADNVVRPPLVIYRQLADGEKERVEPEHPLQQLLTRVNSFWTRGDLWRATSTYIDLWGSCFWLLKKNGSESMPVEIWPLRQTGSVLSQIKTNILPATSTNTIMSVSPYGQMRLSGSATLTLSMSGLASHP